MKERRTHHIETSLSTPAANMEVCRALCGEAPPRIRGFTLIELMVVVAIVGILAAMAYPSYTEYVYKGRRTDAVAALGAVQQAQERYRSNNTTYGTLAQIGSPTTSVHGHYTISMSGAVSATGYTAVATAIGAQASDSKCTTLTVSMANGNVVFDKTGTGTAAACWSR